MESKKCYVVDSSSLIQMNRENPIDIFPSLWKELEDLIKKGLLISHEEVFNEISQQDDMLEEWAKKNKSLFKKPTITQTKIVKEILKKYPSVIKVDSLYQADPWLIALTKELKDAKQKMLWEIKRLIVTEEKIKGNKIRIPLVCNDYNIDCIDRIEMFREEKWSF